jgi:hypothetical protein
MRRIAAVYLTLVILLVARAQAQDANFLVPIGVIERRLTVEPLVVLDERGSRAEGDRTSRVVLTYPDSSVMVVKWAKSAPGGGTFNNEPRYEIAAYLLQKLFLDESDYVVPPTLPRAVPLTWLKQYDSGATPTFDNTTSVVMVMQYWLQQVTPDKFYDQPRLEADTVYARHFGDFNILTYLIRHNDANVGNFLISQNAENPRVFSVDNGVAFRSPISNRGYEWRDIKVKKLPRATVERLRKITPEDLQRALGIVAHFEIRENELVAAEPAANPNPGRGVRRTEQFVQFGLTTAEIRDVENRLRDLIKRLDEGKIAVF